MCLRVLSSGVTRIRVKFQNDNGVQVPFFGGESSHGTLHGAHMARPARYPIVRIQHLPLIPFGKAGEENGKAAQERRFLCRPRQVLAFGGCEA
jgi:hypothetical protein